MTSRYSRLIVATAVASAAVFLLEITCTAAQAARQEASHFNESTPFHAAMYALVRHGATALTGTIAVERGKLTCMPTASRRR